MLNKIILSLAVTMLIVTFHKEYVWWPGQIQKAYTKGSEDGKQVMKEFILNVMDSLDSINDIEQSDTTIVMEEQ